MSAGVIYEYMDGGKYCGEWDNSVAHGHGVCTGPGDTGLFEGRWELGNQASGVYSWPNGQQYLGTWKDCRREGVGKESRLDGTEYAGDFTADRRGKLGVQKQPSGAVYKGSWNNGVQEGEGVETYRDRGVYCGEYKDGYRHGHGSRSSSTYELNAGAADLRSSNNGSSLPPHHSSVVAKAPQLYEGQWEKDRRHGYGVLNVVGHYTYYGEWNQNARTGYGVLMHHGTNKKEEGQWLNGSLVSLLKKKKMSLTLKGHQLESKVKQAHTRALQARKIAHTKAILGESRASAASSRALLAEQQAQQAHRDATVARDKAAHHKGATRISEFATSPVMDVKMDFLSRDSGSALSSNSTTSYLGVPLQDGLSMASSCENLLNMHQSSLTSEDTDGGSSASHSSCDEEEGEEEEEDGEEREIKLESLVAAELREKRFNFKASRTAPTILTDITDEKSSGNTSKRSSSAELLSSSEKKRSFDEANDSVRKRKINHLTGELVGLDEEVEPQALTHSVEKKSESGVLVAKPKPTSADMLTEMVSWNKTIAYLNFVLLIILLFCIAILFVFVSVMNFPQNSVSPFTPSFA